MDQIHVVVASDDEDALAAVTLGVRVPQDIEQVASLDVEDDFFEPDAALRPYANDGSQLQARECGDLLGCRLRAKNAHTHR